MLYKSNDEAIIEMLQKRPGVAAELLKSAIEEDTREELQGIMRLIRAAGYDVSVTTKPKPTPRKRAKTVTAKKAARATLHPTSRGRARRSGAALV